MTVMKGTSDNIPVEAECLGSLKQEFRASPTTVRRWWRSGVFSLATGFAFLAGAIFLPISDGYPKWLRLVPVAGSTLFLWLAALYFKNAPRARKARVAIMTGGVAGTAYGQSAWFRWSDLKEVRAAPEERAVVVVFTLKDGRTLYCGRDLFSEEDLAGMAKLVAEAVRELAEPPIWKNTLEKEVEVST